MLGSVGGDNTASVSGGKTVAIQRRRTVDFLRVDDQSTDATNDIRSKRTRLDLRSVIIIFATSRWLGIQFLYTCNTVDFGRYSFFDAHEEPNIIVRCPASRGHPGVPTAGPGASYRTATSLYRAGWAVSSPMTSDATFKLQRSCARRSLAPPRFRPRNTV